MEAQECKMYSIRQENYASAAVAVSETDFEGIQDTDFEGIREPEAKYEEFGVTLPMTPSAFIDTFLADSAALRFEDLYERLNYQAVTRKPWRLLEDGKLWGMSLDYLAPPPVTWKQELVRVQTTQYYRLLSGTLHLTSSTEYKDFDPLSNTRVEQNWTLRDIAPGKAALTVSLVYRDKALRTGSNLDLALRSQTRTFTKLWYSEAKKRGLLAEKSGPEASHLVAKYEEVRLESRLNLPQITAVYKNLAIYINSGVLVVLLAYLVYLHVLLEARLSDPSCFS